MDTWSLGHLPRVGRVALGALPLWLIFRDIVLVASTAPGVTGVVEIDVVPIFGCMAIGALIRRPVPARGGVAGQTVVKIRMIDFDVVPIGGIVANGTLPGPMAR